MSDHHHDHFSNVNQRRLLLALCLVVPTMAAEIAGGYLAHSLSLVSDGFHMCVDAFALSVAYWAAKVAHKNKKAEAYAAAINGAVLILMSLYIFKSSYIRCFCPLKINCQIVMAVAVVGFLVNLIQIFILRHGECDNINMRGAYLHVVGDTIASLGVIGGGIIIHITGWYCIDPILGFIIAFFIFRYGFALIKNSIKLLKK